MQLPIIHPKCVCKWNPPDTALYGIFRMHGYCDRKRKAFRCESAGEFLSAICCKECFGILEKMAYHFGSVAEDVCLLSCIRIPAGKKMEQICKETSGEICGKNGCDYIGAVSCMALQRTLARSEMELYLLWNVLLCHPGIRGGSRTAQR